VRNKVIGHKNKKTHNFFGTFLGLLQLFSKKRPKEYNNSPNLVTLARAILCPFKGAVS
jgi:hypothetical protein